MDRLARIFAALDYERLAAIYCDEGGDAFWREHRRPAEELGRHWARALAKRLQGGGRSLYVGAGVAEIAAMAHEVCELGREVVAFNLRAAECEILDRAFAAAGVDLRVSSGDARDADGEFDHVAIVSVLTDPETWPQVSGVTYGRLPPVLLDLAAFTAERERITRLVAAVLGRLRLPGVVTTSVDEVPWIMHWAAARGASVVADDETVDTAIVGDPVGFLRLQARPGAG